MKGLARELRVLLLVGIVTAALALLFRENRLLRAENDRLAKLAFDPRPGLFVPSVPVPRLHGDSAILGEMGTSQVLFFFNSICPHCRASIPAWNQIAEDLRTDSNLMVLGVAFDDSLTAEAYRSSQGGRFDIAPVPDPRVASLFRINAVPAMLVVNQEGRITYSRLGPLENAVAVDSVISAVRRLGPFDITGE